MTSSPACRTCGAPCMRRPGAGPGAWYPGCKACWEGYLNGKPGDSAAQAKATYKTYDEHDGVLQPQETSLKWERAIIEAFDRAHRGNPFFPVPSGHNHGARHYYTYGQTIVHFRS